MKDRKTLWQAVKYGLFSASAGIIQEGTFLLLFNLAFGGVEKWYWLCYLIGLLFSIIWNFTLNRRYTFQSAANVPVAMAKVFGFYLVFTPLSTYLGALAEKQGCHDFLILAVTMLSNFILEFLFCKFVVYRGSEDTI